MSFYRIADPKKRDALIAEYIATAKRVKERNLSERLGDLTYRREINKAIKPLIQSNEKSSTAITNVLQPIKNEIGELNKYLREEKRGTNESAVGLTSLLEGDHTRQDMYYGISRKDGRYILGNKEVEIDKDNNNIHVDGQVYEGSPGLWSLIMDTSPKRYTKDDLENYKKLVLQTDLINNPSGVQVTSKPERTNKYKNFLVKIVEEEHEMKNEERERDDEGMPKGKGIQFLPSTIKELFVKLKLLAAEFIAGNTTTRNELVAVLDQLRERGLISEKEYTTINTLLLK